MPTVREITAALDAWAPQGQKADFDRVGLHVGDPQAPARRVLVALDLTAEVVAEAEETGAGLVVTHHPLLFKPIARVTADDPAGALVLRLARAGCAAFAIHTNLDAAHGGVSFALAGQLGLEDVRLLAPLDGVQRKLVTFVPPGHAGAVRDALAGAGAGRIGDYAGCVFEASGTGRFRPLEGAKPFTGTPEGEEEAADEVRIEAELSAWQVPAAVAALKKAHPYEQPAYDVLGAEQPATRTGYGAIGSLPEPEPLPAFLVRVARRLGSDALRYAGRDEQTIRTVAVCGGAGLHFLGHARRARADAYVTADITYHRFFEALGPDGAPRLALIDAGHYETEAITETLIVDHLSDRFPGLDVARTRHRTSPVRTFVPA